MLALGWDWKYEAKVPKEQIPEAYSVAIATGWI